MSAASGGPAIARPLGKRQPHMEGDSPCRPVFCPDAARVSLDDRSCNRQSNPHALRFGRKKWLEYILEFVRRNAGTNVGNGQFGKLADARCPDGDLTERDRPGYALTIRFKMTCLPPADKSQGLWSDGVAGDEGDH